MTVSRPLPSLPVEEAVPALRRALAEAGRAVLAAPPGSGKTTLVPLCLLDEPWLRGKKILMLEPRRVAARAAAARMAWLLGETVGQTVGYQIRFEKKTSAQTRIEVVTEGLLARRLQADPELPGVGLVIFDEFHERSLDADLGLALTLDARANLNPDLRLLVMSATLETQRVARLLDDAPVIESGGSLFPVDIRYLPPRTGEAHDAVVAGSVLTALTETQGDILAFLPGAREIRQAQRRLDERLAGRVRVLPLYGELSSAEQDVALQPTHDGVRKVILATNIAQTSLTVEGVNTVVDGGLVRVARFDLGSGANRLETQRVSRASADQRAGRAGRLGPGRCYRLWSREQQGMLPAHDTPEILAADLTRLALELAAWGVSDPSALALLDSPAPVSWSYARDLLRELGALDGEGRITAHGRELARLPASPRRAHLLVLARQQGLADAAAWVAALLEERDAGSGSDLAEAYAAFRHGRADPQALRRVREAARQLARLVDAGEAGSAHEEAVGRIVSWAYPERIARRRAGQTGVYLCEDGGEARMHEKDALAQSEWLAIAHWDPGPPRKVRLAAVLDEATVLRDHAARVRSEVAVRWDAQTEAVVAEQQRRLGAIVLERRPLREGQGEAVRTAMIAGIRSLGLQVLPWTEPARQWQARVQSLRRWRPAEDWPEVSDAALLATLEDWLGPYLDGVTRRDHLARLDLMAILQARLDYARQQQLSRLAPTHLEVPSGSRIALIYATDGTAPVLAVKLQELFGLAQTPTVDEGRRPVLIHMLSPAQRPVAVTQDLAGFWARGYADVKKDLKGRYPRHPWPDDPLSAPAARRAKPRGT
ncbi:MAG: ATP-dependent helicase HrpB [Nevskiaceae bacterium]|nr:MAG: ATP-dependent helicase HrpB [Nevskiaceae bacterium]